MFSSSHILIWLKWKKKKKQQQQQQKRVKGFRDPIVNWLWAQVLQKLRLGLKRKLDHHLSSFSDVASIFTPVALLVASQRKGIGALSFFQVREKAPQIWWIHRTNTNVSLFLPIKFDPTMYIFLTADFFPSFNEIMALVFIKTFEVLFVCIINIKFFYIDI